MLRYQVLVLAIFVGSAYCVGESYTSSAEKNSRLAPDDLQESLEDGGQQTVENWAQKSFVEHQSPEDHLQSKSRATWRTAKEVTTTRPKGFTDDDVWQYVLDKIDDQIEFAAALQDLYRSYTPGLPLNFEILLDALTEANFDGHNIKENTIEEYEKDVRSVRNLRTKILEVYVNDMAKETRDLMVKVFVKNGLADRDSNFPGIQILHPDATGAKSIDQFTALFDGAEFQNATIAVLTRLNEHDFGQSSDNEELKQSVELVIQRIREIEFSRTEVKDNHANEMADWKLAVLTRRAINDTIKRLQNQILQSLLPYFDNDVVPGTVFIPLPTLPKM